MNKDQKGDTPETTKFFAEAILNDATSPVEPDTAEAAAPDTTDQAPGDRFLTAAQMQSWGQKAMGCQFNPSQDPRVARVKLMYADIADLLNQLRSETESGEVKRLASVAITEAQGAQMWAVKALTWKD